MHLYKINEIENDRFYMLPKSLFTQSIYKGLSLEAKVVYAFLKDRMELSRTNKWINENGELYLIFTRCDLAFLLDVTTRTVIKAMKELNKYELIKEEKTGKTKPNKIFIAHVKICDEKCSEKYSHHTKCSEKYSPHEVKNIHFSEVKNIHSNDTDGLKETYIKETDITPYIPLKRGVTIKNNEIDNLISSYTENEELHKVIKEFVKMRKEIKKPMTAKAIELMLRNLSTLAIDDYMKIKIIEQSIMNSWQGIFPLKNNENNKNESNRHRNAEERAFDNLKDAARRMSDPNYKYNSPF